MSSHAQYLSSFVFLFLFFSFDLFSLSLLLGGLRPWSYTYIILYTSGLVISGAQLLEGILGILYDLHTVLEIRCWAHVPSLTR
jgi:hypothetical protein